MNHKLLIDFMHLLFEFETETKEELYSIYAPTITGFTQWVRDKNTQPIEIQDVGEEQTRLSTEQEIAISFFKLANYSKMYWKSALADSPFLLHDNLIFLVTLAVQGEMSKMELIRKSTQEKSTGMQIVNRLIELNLIKQKDSKVDKRSKVVKITALGEEELLRNREEIQLISQAISGNLKSEEKQTLLQLLTKITQYHQDVFSEPKSKEDLMQLMGKQVK